MDAWPKEGPPVQWTRQLGQGYSAFIAWGDRIATQYQSLSGQYVICMDANTGQTLWEYRCEWAYDPAGVYPGPRATPTYFDGCVHFANPAGLIGCLVRERLKSGMACFVFLAACLLDFLVCRRLSLIFEWVFLGGVFAVVPFSVAARHLFRTRRWYFAWQVVATALAFAALYWSSVAFLYLRVG